MYIIGRSQLKEFAIKHADSLSIISTWEITVKNACWKKGIDVKNTYPKAKIINKNLVSFKINGNKYRLVADINYLEGVVEVVFVGTHNEYDAFNAKTSSTR